MKRLIVLLILCLVLLSHNSFAQARRPLTAPRDAKYAPGRLKVKFTQSAILSSSFGIRKSTQGKPFVGISTIDGKVDQLAIKNITQKYTRLVHPDKDVSVGLSRWYIFSLPDTTNVEVVASEFRNIPEVEVAIPDKECFLAIAPNDPLYPQQWGHNNTAQLNSYNWNTNQHDGPLVGTVGFDANAEEAWNGPQQYGSSNIIIGILDTGIDWGHPDLRIWQNDDPIDGIDNDGNGYVDDIRGWNFGDYNNNSNDIIGHGTCCAGIAAAISNNSIGVSGIAGGCTVMPLRVANNSGDIYNGSIASALYYGANNGAKIISMSLGGSYDQDVQDACNYATGVGVVLLAATGNENISAISYPAGNTNVIAVGAASPCGDRKRSSSNGGELNGGVNPDPNGYTCDGERWWGSNYGSDIPDDASAVDVIAPTIMPTTDIRGSGGYNSIDYESYFNGTSCATPYAAGVCALILSAHPTWTPNQVRTQLISYAQDIVNIESGQGWDKYTGYGMVNAESAFSTHTITVEQRREYNTLITGSTVARWENGNSFQNYTVPIPPFSLPVGSQETFRGQQTIVNSPYEKYYVWERNGIKENDVTNHHSFTIQSYDQNVTSRFKSTNNATIRAQFVEGGNPGGYVDFKDPWLIDYADPLYRGNMRNQGMSAPLKSVVSATNNLGTSTAYKGVFLNKTPDPQNPNEPYYTIYVPQTQTISNRTGVFQNWTVSNAQVQFSTNLTTPVVFTGSNATVTANYKGIHLSGTAAAFSNNSQRKLVRTEDGWLHQVYESMGHIWLEHSTDNGTTWFLGNNGQWLDNGEGKCPSIDWFTYGGENSFVIAFQQRNGNNYTIQFSPFWFYNGTYRNQSWEYGKSEFLYSETVDPYTTNANPNITRAYGCDAPNFVLTFERKNGSTAGINWFCGEMWEHGWYYHQNPDFGGPFYITGTNSNSTNACVHLNKTNSAPGNFDVVFQQGSSYIKGVQLYYYRNQQGQWVPDPEQDLMYPISSGGIYNYKPSMVQMPNLYVRACWIRVLKLGAPYDVNVVYRNMEPPAQYSIYGFLAQSVSINVNDDYTKTFYTFSQNSMFGEWENYISKDGSSYVQLSTAGQDVQLSNGPTSGGNTSMYISSFYPFTPPYYFANAGAIGGQLQKTVPTQMTYGRGATLVKGDLQFSYSLKSLTVDNKNIKFTDIPEKKAESSKTFRRLTEKDMYYPSIDSLNLLLLSEPFSIKSNSSVNFSEQAGFSDTMAAIKAFGSNGYISYKLELIDNTTNRIIAKIKESKFTATSSSSYSLSASSLNVKKLGTKTVRIRITLGTNIDGLLGALVNEYGTITKDALAKMAVNELTLQNSEIPTIYALDQNYPNPFNPSTTIRYQLPNAGHVMLKVYDMLGREVATLVDEMKETGYYSTTFDGARLASGTYIMRLTAESEEGKSFTQTKKMMLLK